MKTKFYIMLGILMVMIFTSCGSQKEKAEQLTMSLTTQKDSSVSTEVAEENTLKENSAEENNLEDIISNYLSEEYKRNPYYRAGEWEQLSYTIMQSVEGESEITYYLMPWYSSFIKNDDGLLEEVWGYGNVCKIVVSKTDHEDDRVIDFQEPGDGAYFVSGIKEIFPEGLQDDAMSSSQLYSGILREKNLNEVIETIKQ